MKPEHYQAVRKSLAGIDAMQKEVDEKDRQIKAAAEKRLAEIQPEIDAASILTGPRYLKLIKERAALHRILA